MSKKSRLDLLVRVRYLNPLPPPPFPPKLFDIPPDISRLGEPSYLSQLAASTPLPMLVDSEMGMPLDLNQFGGVWNGDDSLINPTEGMAAELDPEDVILLAPVSATAPVNGSDRPGPPAPTEVSWMRTSNLFMRKMQNKRRDAADKANHENEVDASEAAQVLAIEQSFEDITKQDPTQIRHPDAKKRKLEVIESYDIFPDDNWGEVSYVMIRFPDRPSAIAHAMSVASERPSSPRLKRALLLPKDNDGQQEIDYFIPTEEDVPRLDDVFDRAVGPEVVEEVNRLAEEDPSASQIDEILPSTHYDRARTYETVSSQKPQKEIILTFEEPSPGPNKRPKGVYYQNVFMRTLLRKARAKRREEYEESPSFDKLRVGYSQPTEEDQQLREAHHAQVTDPAWAEERLQDIRDEGYDLNAELEPGPG